MSNLALGGVNSLRTLLPLYHTFDIITGINTSERDGLAADVNPKADRKPDKTLELAHLQGIGVYMRGECNINQGPNTAFNDTAAALTDGLCSVGNYVRQTPNRE